MGRNEPLAHIATSKASHIYVLYGQSVSHPMVFPPWLLLVKTQMPFQCVICQCEFVHCTHNNNISCSHGMWAFPCHFR